PPGPPEAVADDDPRHHTEAMPERCAQRRRRAVWIAWQEQHALARAAVGDVRAIDARVGHYESETVTDDEHVGHRAQHFSRLGEDQLHEARVLARDRGELTGADPRHHGGEVDQPTFGLRDHFL